ncbi:RNA-splicing factor, partial [Linderina macrospora]
MYNGIGLTTPRGTGTSGHVVRNASALKPGQKYRRVERKERAPKPTDPSILEHERKRQVEIKCLSLQDELEEQGLDDAEVERRVDELRQQLLDNLETAKLPEPKLRNFETQRVRQKKERENERFARAMRIGKEHVEGEAFDPELVELKRRLRRLEREEERAVREEEEEQRRRDRERERRLRYERSRSRDRRRSVSANRSRSPTPGRAVDGSEPGEIEDTEPVKELASGSES